ncbi:MAG: hypothetical protein HY706_04495 [Candidatus Hydrogenedentes bacterium]|nr:hypothetical protein [Candidatus Hydrogenedentota bacterium]
MVRAIAIGERHLILGFKGVGLDVVPVQDGAGLHKELMHLARDSDVGLVLVTESMANEAPQSLRDFREVSGAILTVIPTHEGSRHFGFEEMRKAMERSIGVDLLGKE